MQFVVGDQQSAVPLLRLLDLRVPPVVGQEELLGFVLGHGVAGQSMGIPFCCC